MRDVKARPGTDRNSTGIAEDKQDGEMKRTGDGMERRGGVMEMLSNVLEK